MNKSRVFLVALTAMSGCMTDAGNYSAMRGFVGRSIGSVIISNGQPESRVDIGHGKFAYTFHMRNQSFDNGTSMTVDCRFTFIVASSGAHSDQSKVIDVMDPGANCR